MEKAVVYGKKYAVIQYRGEPKPEVLPVEAVELVPDSGVKDGTAFRYFVSVAQSRVEQAQGQSAKDIAANVLRQFDKISPQKDTALHAYCSGQNQQRDWQESLIYPFGVNQSQLKAVESAFASQVSVVEGPPGTGKTQTILNIVANVVLAGKTVAILSNNNAAVENVYEKLDKVGLGHLVARLGNRENRDAFFASLPEVPEAAPGHVPEMQRLQDVLERLKQYLHALNEEAQLQADIDELAVEQSHLQQWQRENHALASVPLEKYKLTPRKTTDLMAYLSHLGEKRIRFRNRLALLLGFGILRTKPFDDRDKRRAAIHALQLHYYDTALRDKRAALAVCREALARGDFNALLNELTAGSMAYLKHHLKQRIQAGDVFDENSYRQKIDAFVKCYPVIGSSTHSLVNSTGGAVFDYVIIDEASQQDIVPGVLALGCARNLIIVGDRKQLAHIPSNLGVAPPAEFYDCDKYSLLDSCLGIFGDTVPTTLLREHYRCHPRIIQFCNQQFYDGQLIPMTRDHGEKALALIVTAKGNHARNHANLRELDSLRETLGWDGESDWDAAHSRGFIAPYRAQVSLSHRHLPEIFAKDTVHKFQGRECDEIVFSTVLDKQSSSLRSLSFVDNAQLINVAVSRAKNKFTLVTGDDVFAGGTGNIAALVRYLEYYADEAQVHRAPVVSAFDLLYQEYDQSLERLNAKLRPEDSQFKSEQIVAQILRDALEREIFRAMTFHTQVAVNQLASAVNEALTSREREFMRQGASCDFVVYFRVGKRPLGVIEVDGGYHDTSQQAERDALKNSILEKSGIPLLRLQTIESRVDEKVIAFMAQWVGDVQNEGGQGGEAA